MHSSCRCRRTGKDDFVITTYDQSPTGNTIPATAKQLGAGVDVKGIGKKGKTITAVVGGVVASTSLFLSQGAVSSIDATKFSAIVVPRDADGNAIVTDQYESATGTHVKITLGSSGNPSFRFSPNNFSSAAKGLAVTVNYKPSGVTGAQVQNGFSTVLTATANNGATVGSATFAALAPTSPSSPRRPSLASRSRSRRAATVRSGSRSSCGKIARIPTNATSGTQITEFAIPSAGAQPFGITSGPDGQMWFTEQGGNKIGHIPVTATSGSDISEIALPTAGSVPTGITAGSDNALYFTEQAGTSWAHSDERHQHVGHYGDHAAGSRLGSFRHEHRGGRHHLVYRIKCANSVAHMPVGATLPSQITSITMPTAAS